MHFGQHLITCRSRMPANLAYRSTKSLRKTAPKFILMLTFSLQYRKEWPNGKIQWIDRLYRYTYCMCYPVQWMDWLIIQFCMGCGSSVAQVSDSIKEGLFKPIRLLQMDRQGEGAEMESRLFLFGETRTQRKILELDLVSGNMRAVSSRVRIPVPRITYDPIELMYEQSQEIFHLGVYGLSVQPPFNRMLAICLQNNVIFLTGGKDFDGYNIKNEAFYYSISDDPTKEGPTYESCRTQQKSKYSTNKFQKVASMNSRRYGHMGIYIHKLKSVLVFGGFNDKEEIVNTCERYGVMDNNWKDFTSMHVARAFAHCFQFGNKVYVFGGRTNTTKKSKKIEVFDLETHQWEILPFKIHRGIEDALITSLNPNEIMIIGGKTISGPTKSVIKIDLFNQSYVWDSNISNDYHVVKGAKTRFGIIIFGGAKNTMQTYINGQWSTKNFEHKKYVELEQMDIFSISTQSLHVANRKPQFAHQEKIGKQDLILFGNDQYPCLLVCTAKENNLRKCSVPMACKIRSKMAIIEYEAGKYFMAGGCDWKEKKSFNSCYFYNAETNQMLETVKMSEKKHNFAITYHDGFIYVFGGYDCLDKTAKKSCAKFSVCNEGWDLLPTLRRARNRCHSLPISSNKIAVFGGVNGGEPVAGIEIFNISERKFDIYEPSLHLPPSILHSYTQADNQNNIFILSQCKGQASGFQLTTITLAANHQASNRSSISNNLQTIDMGERVEKKTEIISSKVQSNISNHQHESSQHHAEDAVIIRVKPKLVEIQPKLQSESSQVNHIEQSKQPSDDAESSFHLEKIDLKKNKVQKSITEQAEDLQKEEKKQEELVQKLDIHQQLTISFEGKKMNTYPKTERQIPQIGQILERPPLKLSESKIEETFKLISTQPIQWLPPNNYYQVAVRLEGTYFLAQSISIKFDKISEKAFSIELKNSSKVPISAIK